MRKKLAFMGMVKLFSGLILMGFLLFLPAGTFHYPGAWRMLLVLFVPMFLLGFVLLIAKPALLEKRLSQKETEGEQKLVILYSGLMFISVFLLCGFDERFSFSHVPHWLSVCACFLFLLTYAGFAELLRENEYLSRTVEVREGQQVVSTGLYGVVRHPMYAIIFFMFLSMPLIIGSFVGMVPMVFLPYILVKRIINEEEVLVRELAGYEDYKKKVRFRLIPMIW